MLLQEDELAYLREDAASMLPDDVSVIRMVNLPDGAGGQQVSWESMGTTLKGRLASATKAPTETQEGGRQLAIIGWKLLLPWDADIQATDRLEINGETFEVNGTNRGLSEQILLEVTLKRV